MQNLEALVAQEPEENARIFKARMPNVGASLVTEIPAQRSNFYFTQNLPSVRTVTVCSPKIKGRYKSSLGPSHLIEPKG